MTASCDNVQTRRLRNLVFDTVACIDSSDVPIPTPLVKQMDRTIRHAVLYGIPNNFSSALTAELKSSTPFVVKRVEEWIDAHWKEDITAEKLAEVAGVSLRSIQATFKRVREYTPMAYLKKVRLRAAHAMLADGEPGVTVTQVAFACNFMSTSYFTHEYCQQFGELPSETLRRRDKCLA